MKSRIDGEIEYQASEADKLPPPRALFSEERYVGYREVDFAKPYSRFFRETPLPLQPHVVAALRSGPVATGQVVPLKDVAREMSRPGYLDLETGFGVAADGTACVACLTDMPAVEPAMWSWWFGWHLAESARYKLWHPAAHVFTAPGRATREGEAPRHAQTYIGNVSYIEEFIGSRLMRLAVRFTSPSTLGFTESTQDVVTIVGRGGPSHVPVTAVWLIHQVRRTSQGSEMRSRFYIGQAQPLKGVASIEATVSTQAEPGPTDLLEHCGTEMNHLASFLPDLYRSFA